jgi:glycosyltransferase involved in cell wall biosynthesis
MDVRSLASLYRSCDVLVAPSRAEAFCLPVLEAMASGLPSVVPDGGAMDDFCPEAARYSVRTEHVVGALPDGRRLGFLEPDPLSLRAQMRLAYADDAGRKEKGAHARVAATGFAWTRVTRWLVAQALAAQPSER